ncbi:transmembrane adaptor Erv26-domain-containing protein [Scleroderma yunnanense]
MTLLHYFSYVGSVVAFGFMTLSLASGLLYISELIEEYSRLAKLIGQRGTYLVIAFHVLLYICDSLPLPQTLFSILCHTVYLQNFSNTWPVISLSSVSFIASCILSVTNHFMWFMYFSRISREARQSYSRHRGPVTETPSFADIATFFGSCVWLVPLFLFLSLSANDNALPTSGSSPGADSTLQRGKTSLFKSMFGIFGKGGATKPMSPEPSNGLIAPPSPVSARHSSPVTPLSPHSPFLGPPPRTPRTPTRKFAEGESKSPQSIRLGPPPGRSPQVRRRATADNYSPSLMPRQSYVSGGFDHDD